MPDRETWRDVPGYEGYYQVSDLGRVKSLARVVPDRRVGQRSIPEKILKHGIRSGYESVLIQRRKIRTNRTVHSLVAEAFLGPKPDGSNVCHKNGNSADNRPENLRYDSQRGNIRDSVRHGTHRNTRKSYCKRGHPLLGDNLYVNPGSGARVCRTCQKIWQRGGAR